MTRTRLLKGLLPALAGAALLAAPARAQREAYSYLSYAGPDVSLASQDQEDTAARVNTPISAGDRVTTGQGSRAEAILADGTVVRLDGRTEVRFDRLARTWQSQDERTLVALVSGALAVETRRSANEDEAIRIDTDDATVVVPERGLVRVDAGPRGTEVFVLAGSAEVMARAGRATVRAGETASVSGSDPVDVEGGDLPRDRFTQFVTERSRVPRGESLRYLEQTRQADDVGDDAWDEDGYGYSYDASLLDDAGSWVYVPTYSRWCWRPRVGVDWRPYSLGYWRPTFGSLSWVSYEPWGWLPYHYGSWFLDASFGWCWSPGWSYSPAWVYWNYTPGWIGWCPTGYYGAYDAWYGRGPVWRGGRFEWNRYPHLRGRVDVTKIDPRGWNYVHAGRLGTRFERGDVVRGDRVSFRPGEVGVIATAPFRYERRSGVPVHTVVQDAARRELSGSGTRAVDANLTQILRRERNLPESAAETLRRATVTVGRDAAYRAPRSEPFAGGRFESAGSAQRTQVRGDAWRNGRVEANGAGRFERGGTRADAQRTLAPRSDEGWRSTSRGDASRFRRDDSGWRSTASRNEAAPREAPRREDSGWRSPGRSETAPRADTPRRDDSGWRSPSPGRSEVAPRAEAPRRDDSGWRAPAPRGEARPSMRFSERPAPAPRYEPRSFERAPAAPRYEPRSFERAPAAPRYEPRSFERAPAAPRYEARSAPAPRSEAPRSAPAPSASRGEAPHRRP